MDISLIQVQFLGNLLIRQVQPHEIETQHPDFDRLMVSRQWRPSQVIKLLLTTVADVALASRLIRVKASFRDPVKATVRAMHPSWPPQFANRFIAFGIVDKFLYLY
jgi:hypothetical protein